MRAKLIQMLPVVSPKLDTPGEERCLGEGNSDTNSSDARSSNIGNNLKHREYYARDNS
jgi:hypothetical protein